VTSVGQKVGLIGSPPGRLLSHKTGCGEAGRLQVQPLEPAGHSNNRRTGRLIPPGRPLLRRYTEPGLLGAVEGTA
jgi:hypothetical protein